jgi:hypothetical protein
VAIEVAILLVFGVIAVACGRPIVQAFSEKMKASYKEMEPKQVTEFRTRISELEEQVRQMKTQVENAQQTADFAMKLLHEHETNSSTGQKLNLSAENKQRLEEGVKH